MPANLGTESVTVQHPLTRYAGQAGWAIVPKEDATTLRRGESGLFFYDLLKAKLQELNRGIVTPELADDIIHRLESVRNNIEGNSEILAWLRGERSVYVEAEKRQRNVTLVDFKDASKNDFHVTEEWQYTNGSNTNRADAVFLINGLPIAVAEARSAKKDNAMEEALIQIRRYAAPVLYCMYLDKPMRDHVLLQAIARVNRPFEQQNIDGGERRKPCGLIVDFVGVLRKLKKALKFDSKDVSGVVENLDVLFADFVRRMSGPAKDCLALATGRMDDKAVEKAIDAFEDKTKREAFYKFFKELEQLYEILSPDDTFAIYWELKRHLYKHPKKLAIALTEPFRRFPNFNSNADEMRQLKAELYRILLPEVQGKKMVEIADRLIKVRTR